MADAILAYRANVTKRASADPSLYDSSFFTSFADYSYEAAKTLLPRLYGIYPFHSLVDFGCGSGTWLRAAADTIPTTLAPLTGIDGEYARDVTRCDGATFIFQDLEQRVVVERHDLAISLEVAEHLSPARAGTFVEDLCAASDVVFFSAAVVGQGGTNHINEQPQSYWVKLFAQQGYQPFLFHRRQFWDHPAFAPCPFYIASSFLYVKEQAPLFATLAEFRPTDADILDVVHPNTLRARSLQAVTLKQHLRDIGPSLVRAIRARI